MEPARRRVSTHLVTKRALQPAKAPLRIRRSNLHRAILPLLVLANACESPTAPDATLPAGATRFTVPAVYQRWWAMTAACSASSAPFEKVTWYFVDGASFARADGTLAYGTFDDVANRIVIAGIVAYHGDVMRHVMLHAQLGTAAHPRSAFLGSCAGVVACDGVCVRDVSTPAPSDTTALQVAPGALTTSVSVSRATVSQRERDDFFEIVVAVTNPATHAVVVKLEQSGDAGPPGSFSYAMTSADQSFTAFYSERAWDVSTQRFAPGETKRWIFDIKASQMPPTTYRVSGDYGLNSAAQAASVTVTP